MNFTLPAMGFFTLASLSARVFPALFLTVLTSFPALAEPVAEVVALRGFAQVVTAGRTTSLRVGARIGEGSEIRTATPGRAKLRFIDGSVMVLGDASRLKIEKFRPETDGRPRNANFLLDVGLLSQTVAPSTDGRWSVRTPSAVTAVRGTEYVVEVTPDRVTDVHVRSGAVSVEPVRKIRLRGEAAPPPMLLDRANLGTSCDAAGQCQASRVWKEERVRALLDRLDGV